MKNRARCKLCNDIIESKHRHNYVTCKCGEISIDGGSGNGFMRCIANDPANLIHIDDEGNEIVLKIKEPEVIPEVVDSLPQTPPTRKELMDTLDGMLARVEELPRHAMLAPLSHYDYQCLLLLMKALFSAKD